MPSAEDARIDVRGIAKRFGQRTVLRALTFAVVPGELVVLTGSNGGGKTTTLRILAGLLAPDGGEGQVLGRDVRYPARADRAQIGFMTQRLALYPELDVTQNLRFRAAMHGLGDAAVRGAIDAFGLADYAKTRIDRLSGGWARRTQFAATTLHAPALVLLDEPTAGLDAATRADIWARLHAMAGRGHSIVMSTHDLAEAAGATRRIDFDGAV
jgi:ABC-2 type transport system ATP-binding protein